jgi:hypothetical protein
METLKERKAWNEVFCTFTENKLKPKILYPAKQSFNIDVEIKIFHNKQKLKHCMTTKPPLQIILQRILHTEDKNKQNHQKMCSIKPKRKKR